MPERAIHDLAGVAVGVAVVHRKRNAANGIAVVGVEGFFERAAHAARQSKFIVDATHVGSLKVSGKMLRFCSWLAASAPNVQRGGSACCDRSRCIWGLRSGMSPRAPSNRRRLRHPAAVAGTMRPSPR